MLLARGSQSFLNNQRLRHYPNRESLFWEEEKKSSEVDVWRFLQADLKWPMRKRHFVLPCCVSGCRIPASCSIRGSWRKPCLQTSVCVPASKKRQPVYTGIARWNGLSFLAKTETNSWHGGERLFPLLSFFLRSHARKPVSCLLGSLDICAHTFQLPPTTHYLPLIPFKVDDWLRF